MNTNKKDMYKFIYNDKKSNNNNSKYLRPYFYTPPSPKGPLTSRNLRELLKMKV